MGETEGVAQHTHTHTERSSLTTPEFNGGSFTARFSTSPEGFTVKTAKTIRRTEDTHGYPLEVAGDPQATQRNKAILGTGVKGEAAFQGADKVRVARENMVRAQNLAQDAHMSGSTPDVIANLDEEARQAKLNFATEQHAYTKGMMGKVGFSEIHIDEDTNVITVVAKSVPFPTYRYFANPEDSADLQALSRAAATSMIVRTADGKIIVQHRSSRNANYADIPGASVAGMLDASIESPAREKGHPDPVDTTSVKSNILKEADEELGLEHDDLYKIRIAGIARDKVKIHDEFLLLADSHLTFDQIKEKAKAAKRNRTLGDADFEEKFVAIDGTPQAIETLLTQVHCPLPPTHAAALVAAGYSLVLEEQGLDAANEWRDRLEQGVAANYQTMDEIVTRFYDKHPEALMQIPERFWGKTVPARNLHGYTPAYSPEEQGLPNFEDEMTRVRLIEDHRSKPETAYLFDIDGVLSDLREKRITEDGIYEELVRRIQNGEPVGLITGRSNIFVKPIMEELSRRIIDKSLLQNVAAVGEKGGTWMTFDSDGNILEGRSDFLVVPDDLKERVRALATDSKFSHAMFFDETKETMLTIEMTDGFELAEFHRAQTEFVAELNGIISEQETWEKYRVDPTNIATDIESRYVGKSLGADRFIQFLRDRGITPKQFKAFGDSKSDIEMADELERKGKKVEMVYVGDRAKLGEIQKDYPVTYVVGFSQGTLFYLKEMNKQGI